MLSFYFNLKSPICHALNIKKNIILLLYAVAKWVNRTSKEGKSKFTQDDFQFFFFIFCFSALCKTFCYIQLWFRTTPGEWMNDEQNSFMTNQQPGPFILIVGPDRKLLSNHLSKWWGRKALQSSFIIAIKQTSLKTFSWPYFPSSAYLRVIRINRSS